ncbi:hypothetical protein [Mesorhizobium sp. M2A.F.Ca.ET.043.05.1.1]|uniref:hypothetical protein n=1 Tax=Mesorhizobium sp. M2A.F.Ca.ET.043.05.1.1 TaxID=2493671 RepID=UPI0032B0F6C0
MTPRATPNQRLAPDIEPSGQHQIGPVEHRLQAGVVIDGPRLAEAGFDQHAAEFGDSEPGLAGEEDFGRIGHGGRLHQPARISKPFLRRHSVRKPCPPLAQGPCTNSCLSFAAGFV